MAREGQKMRSETVRQTILDTALEMGIREGFEAVTVRKIINRINYSTGVVYHHFKDKQEIIDAIEAEETAELYRAIAERLDQTKDVVYNMKTVFQMITRLAFEQPEKFNLIVLHKYSRQSASQPHWIVEISRSLQQGMQAGLIKEMNPDQAAFSIWSSFLGFNLMISRQANLTVEEVEAMFQIQLDIILKGVMKHE